MIVEQNPDAGKFTTILSENAAGLRRLFVDFEPIRTGLWGNWGFREYLREFFGGGEFFLES
jgi:hypothetical protein